MLQGMNVLYLLAILMVIYRCFHFECERNVVITKWNCYIHNDRTQSNQKYLLYFNIRLHRIIIMIAEIFEFSIFDVMLFKIFRALPFRCLYKQIITATYIIYKRIQVICKMNELFNLFWKEDVIITMIFWTLSCLQYYIVYIQMQMVSTKITVQPH